MQRPRRLTFDELNDWPGAWIFYFGLPGGPRLSSANPVSLRRAPLSGGPSELVLNERGFAFIHCARPPSDLCVISQRDNKQLAFFAFDPLRGKGRELIRLEASPQAAHYTWSLSPDGSRIALMGPGAPRDRFQILPLDGKARHEVIVDGWSHLQELHWTADGKGWFVTDLFGGTGTLLYVDSKGHAQKLWQLSTTDLWSVPSPDGRYLAFPAESASSNVWMVESF